VNWTTSKNGGSSTTACSGSPVSSGTSPCTITLTPGTWSVTATYSGDSIYAGGSQIDTFTTPKGAATVTFTPAPTHNGQNWTLSATVTGPFATPSGTVTWSYTTGGSSQALSCGGSSSTSLSGAGVTTCQTSLSNHTAYVITATYNGDNNYQGGALATLPEST
jgi:hypothetical protein